MRTETIDRLFLELSQVTSAKTERELKLEARVEVLERALTCLKDLDAALTPLPYIERDSKLHLCLTTEEASRLREAHVAARWFLNYNTPPKGEQDAQA